MFTCTILQSSAIFSQQGPVSQVTPPELAVAAKALDFSVFRCEKLVLPDGREQFFLSAGTGARKGRSLTISLTRNRLEKQRRQVGTIFKLMMAGMQLPPRGEAEVSAAISRASILASGFGLADDLYFVRDDRSVLADWSLPGLDGDVMVQGLAPSNDATWRSVECIVRESVSFGWKWAGLSTAHHVGLDSLTGAEPKSNWIRSADSVWRMRVAGHQLVVPVGSYTIQVDGRSVELSAPVLDAGGTPLVPSDIKSHLHD